MAVLALLLSSLFYFFSYPEVDPDLWGHLYFGREIVQGAKLPLENLYSYTAPSHPWINHEWLAEVIFYWFFDLFGSPGLILLKVTLGAGVVWVLDLTLRSKVRSLFVRVITLAWTMAILSPGFNVRPQIFTYLFFATFLFLFYRYEEGHKAVLYWAPVLMVLWVNLHGGFVVGLGALGLFALWTLTTGPTNRETRRPAGVHLLAPFLLSFVSLLINPYGFGLPEFLARDLLLNRPITEWEPISLLDFSFLEFKLAFLFVLFFSLWRGAWRRWDFYLMLLTAFFAFRHQRHTPLFGIAAAPFLATGVQRIYQWVKERARGGVLTAAILAIAFYQIAWIGRIHFEHQFQLVVNPREYPTQAADFLKRNGIRGNLAVPFDWGEYFIWKLYPDIRVSIDGRYTTAYPAEVIRGEWEWMKGGREWKRLLNSYPTDLAITKRSHPVTQMLRKDPEWLYIYSDPVAFVFIRKTTSQEALLKKFREKKLLLPQSPPIHFPG